MSCLYRMEAEGMADVEKQREEADMLGQDMKELPRDPILVC